MTESLTFSLYSLMMLALALGWNSSKRRYFALAGLVLGLALSRAAVVPGAGAGHCRC